MTLLEKLGVKIGHYTNNDDLTGATVFIPDNGADIGLDIRGSDTGTFNTPAYDVKGADKTVRAVVLTGGSTFGLECVVGVMDFLQTPCVTGAVIYDRHVGNDTRPHKNDGYKMAENASYADPGQGNIGVGTGATTGKWLQEHRLKGGFGYAVKEVAPEAYIGVFAVVNAIGSVVDPSTGRFYSESGGYNADLYYNKGFGAGEDANLNTTLAVVITNIEMERPDLMKVAELAHDGMARAVFPVHTTWDGDTIFAISPHCKNRVKLDIHPFYLPNYVGICASTLLSEAINNAVKAAEPIAYFPSWSEVYGE